MKKLDINQSCTVLKLSDHSLSTRPLSEQAAPFLEKSPNLILDVAGIDFNSMLLGEIVNLHNSFAESWQGRTPRISLVIVSRTSRSLLGRANLRGRFYICDSLPEAFDFN